ncbi:MAG TPA: uracil-DNA glycosylase [Candidatus Paceibacterota bacterium]|nr:uracil-DNA glycosylase [Candidatus Paceibacterota bacterium]
MTETKTLTSVNKALQEKFKGRTLVFGRGASSARVVVVSEMLDAHGEKEKKPVGGPHAKMLNALLKQAGISPQKVYVTNVVKYRPNPEHMPTPKEIKSHATFLKEEIRTVNPDIVITLGNLALNGVGLRIPVENVHGRTFPLGTYRLLPTFHPERAAKDPITKILLEQDFAKVKELMKQPKEATE